MVNSGWAKLDKYYTKTEETPVYIAAVVLDPTQKWAYFEEHWDIHPDWQADWRVKVEAFWTQFYRPVDVVPTPVVDSQRDPQQENNLYVALLQARRAARAPADEYQRYISLPPLPEIFNPLQWWMEESQRQSYPNLSRMALDLLTVPAMSADAERLFSGANLTISDRRNRLGIKMIESLECLRSWMKLGDWQDDGIEEWQRPMV